MLAVLALGGVALAVTADEEPTDDIRTSPPVTVGRAPSSTAPAAGNPSLATPVTLPDGVVVVLEIPGPEHWTRRYADVELTLADGLEVEVSLTARDSVRAEWEVEERLSDRAAVVRWGESRALAVEIDGWVATVGLDGEDGDLPDERTDEVARDLTFTVGPGGPVDVGGPGMTVGEVRVDLTREADIMGMESVLTVAHVAGGPHPTCAGDPPVSALSRSQRCVADDQILLSARGSTTQTIIPGIEGTLEADAGPAGGSQVPVSLADGTEVVLTILDGAWAVTDAVAWVDIEGVASGTGPIHVMLHAETALQTAAQAGSTLEVIDNGRYLVTDRSGRVELVVEGGGWNASLPLDDAAAPVSDDVRDRLERTLELEASPAGPSELRADGLEVVEVLAIVSATDPPVDRTTGAIDSFYVTRYEEDDGEVRVDPVGPRADAAFPALTFEASVPD